VDEVDAEAPDLGAEVGEPVELRLLLAPIEAVSPVVRQLPQVGQVRAVVPARPRDLVGEARAIQALPQVVERIPRDTDVEGLHAHAPDLLPCVRRQGRSSRRVLVPGSQEKPTGPADGSQYNVGRIGWRRLRGVGLRPPGFGQGLLTLGR
jgi:hypothetical protein